MVIAEVNEVKTKLQNRNFSKLRSSHPPKKKSCKIDRLLTEGMKIDLERKLPLRKWMSVKTESRGV